MISIHIQLFQRSEEETTTFRDGETVKAREREKQRWKNVDTWHIHYIVEAYIKFSHCRYFVSCLSIYKPNWLSFHICQFYQFGFISLTENTVAACMRKTWEYCVVAVFTTAFYIFLLLRLVCLQDWVSSAVPIRHTPNKSTKVKFEIIVFLQLMNAMA